MVQGLAPVQEAWVLDLSPIAGKLFSCEIYFFWLSV